MWKLTYAAPVGCRIKKDVFSGICLSREPDGLDYWFEHASKLFKPHDKINGAYSTHGMYNINSVKAFVKYLNKHCHHLKQFEIMLCSRYFVRDSSGKFLYDYSVSAKWVPDCINS